MQGRHADKRENEGRDEGDGEARNLEMYELPYSTWLNAKERSPPRKQHLNRWTLTSSVTNSEPTS